MCVHKRMGWTKHEYAWALFTGTCIDIYAVVELGFAGGAIDSISLASDLAGHFGLIGPYSVIDIRTLPPRTAPPTALPPPAMPLLAATASATRTTVMPGSAADIDGSAEDLVERPANDEMARSESSLGPAPMIVSREPTSTPTFQRTPIPVSPETRGPLLAETARPSALPIVPSETDFYAHVL